MKFLANPNEVLLSDIEESLINEANEWFGDDHKYNHKKWGVSLWIANGPLFLEIYAPEKLKIPIINRFYVWKLIKRSKAIKILKLKP